MAEKVKIGEDSICPGCEITPPQEQCAQCFTCKSYFHGVCKGAVETHVGTLTMVKLFLAASTKSNFKFYCDICLTNLERNLVETEDQKIETLTKEVNSMKTTLSEIVTYMKTSTTNQQSKVPSLPPDAQKKNIWYDQEKLSAIKAPASKALLVIKKNTDAAQHELTRSNVAKTIMENKIAVSQSYDNKDGDMIVVCDSEGKRNELKNLVASKDNNIEMNTPSKKRKSITIVGLRQQHEKDEIIDMLVLQNGFINRFSRSNEIRTHIEIHSVQPLKNNPDLFQVFASVSPTLREGLHLHRNKVTLGLTSCKIYDRYHVKRCNNCQRFGHYMNECPTPDVRTCGKCCSNHHSTRDCTSTESVCINCVRESRECTTHHTSDYKCPVFRKQQELKKQNTTLNSLNWGNRYTALPP